MHFQQRCIDRGITDTNSEALWEALRIAILDGNESMAEPVMPGDGEAWIYRFKVPEGIFYTVAGPDGRPRTILTQGMVARKKQARKMRKRARSKKS